MDHFAHPLSADGFPGSVRASVYSSREQGALS